MKDIAWMLMWLYYIGHREAPLAKIWTRSRGRRDFEDEMAQKVDSEWRYVLADMEDKLHERCRMH
jgi:hypothetical protein